MVEDTMRRLAAEMTPQRFVLDNGLTVLVCEMPAFRGVHAVFGTHFGSADTCFEVDGQRVELPAGTAHFLEHKMFEDAAGRDAFSLFAATGASANAFTSFERTCYVFTATDRVEENLDILLDFVSHPYFSEQTVQKEQGIIAQEIEMYRDNPGFRMTFGLLQALYHRHPVRQDVAGTVQSIAQITPALLYRCCEAFYAPENMVLSVAGNVRARQVLKACARAQLPAGGHTLRRLPVKEPITPCKRHVALRMQVAQPVWGIGYKADGAIGGTVKGEIICDFVVELLTGDTSPFYRRIYDEGLITEAFSGEFVAGPGYCALIFGGETRHPRRLRRAFLQEAERLCREGIDAEQFACTKNLMLGAAIMELEDMEAVATAQAAVHMKGHTLYSGVETLAALTVEEVQAALPRLLDIRHSATILISPADASAVQIPQEDEV